MTTIAVNRSMMAGDKQFTHSSGMMITGVTKIYELPVTTAESIFDEKRVLIGFAGNADKFADIIGWLHLPEGKPPGCKGVEMLMLNGRGQIYHGTNLGNWLQVKEPFFAIGSGMQFAVAAMAAGKTPYEAVKIASKYDPSTGRGFNKIEL